MQIWAAIDYSAHPEKGLRGSGAGTLGVPLGGTRRVGGLLGVAGRCVSHSVMFDSATAWTVAHQAPLSKG